MASLPITNPYERHLIGLLHAVDKQLRMAEEDIVLIILSLDTEEKIVLFIQWLQTKCEGEKVLAKPNEIVRAAVEIGEGTMDLP